MICPNCGFEQEESPECIKCGIVVSKFRDREEREPPPTPAAGGFDDLRENLEGLPGNEPYSDFPDEEPPPSSRRSSKIKWWWLVLAALVIFFAYRWWSNRPIVQGPGVMAPEEPLQVRVGDPETFTHEGYTLTPLAVFSLKARVLSTERYHMDKEADLSPIDVALGWGKMSDETVLKDIKISQSNRFYYWRTDNFPIPRKEIETCSANMHMIPAAAGIFSVLKRLRRGNIIELSGMLVKIADDEKGWKWRSSMTRDDTGMGACEVIWVKSVEIVK